ncbi:MAG TPA: dihydropteroate synthase [Chitinophagales bacterium]|nr:dihydropteroate synthase [Chitinophagales bacterium]
MTIHCREKILDLTIPKIMGILNLTPDSFYDGGKFGDAQEALKHTEKMLSEGAAIIDMGAMSSRSGAAILSGEEELQRLLPVLEAVRKKFPEALISVDTLRAKVAQEALERGAHIINDITAGRFEPEILEVTAHYKAAFVAMHMQGLPATMQKEPYYENVTSEVLAFFEERLNACHEAGIKDVILDVGFGFGKTTEHNYALLDALEQFTQQNAPVLAGLSRKSMICKLLKVNPENALAGTIAANTIALIKGATILRVHDVKEAVQTVEVFRAANSR